MRKFFSLCAEIEETIGAIYSELALQFSSDPELKGLWEALARDEADHVNQIRMAARLPEEKVVHSRNIPLERVHQLKEVASAILREVRTEELSCRRCLELGARLEEDFRGVHAHCAVNFLDETMGALFRALAWEDERHARMISEYCQASGIRLEEGQE